MQGRVINVHMHARVAVQTVAALGRLNWPSRLCWRGLATRRYTHQARIRPSSASHTRLPDEIATGPLDRLLVAKARLGLASSLVLHPVSGRPASLPSGTE